MFSAIWMVWAPLNLLWTPTHAAGVREIDGSVWCIVASFAAVALTQGRPSRLVAMRVGWIIAFMATSVIAGWEMVTHHHLISSVGYKWAFTADTVVTTFKNPNDYAWFLLACLSIFIFQAMRARTALLRSLYTLLTACSALLIVPSQSRGALGVVALFIILTAVWVWNRVPRSARRRLLKVVIASSVLVLVGLVTPPGEALRANVAAAFPANAATALSDNIRIRMILTGIRYFLHSYGIGIGAGAFEHTVLHDPRAHVAPLINAHNTFIEMASQYGIVATVPFLAVFAAVIMAMVRSRRVAAPGQQLLDLRMHLVMILLVIVDAGVVSSSVLTDTTWWMLIAYATALGWQLSRTSADAKRARRSGRASNDAPHVLQDAV